MISIEVNGKRFALPIKISRHFESEILNRENTATDYTYPAEMELTDEIKLALNFPDSINRKSYQIAYDATIYINDIHPQKVTLQILEVDTGSKKIKFSLFGNYGSFALIVGDTKLSQLALGGTRTIGTIDAAYQDWRYFHSPTNLNLWLHLKSCNSHLHMGLIASGSITTDYVFYTAIDDNMSLQTPNKGLNVINWFYSDGATMRYEDPIKTMLMDACHFQTPIANNKYYWVPQFRLHYVIRKCFEEFGFTIAGGGILDLFKFQQIAIHNTYCINRCSANYVTSMNQADTYITHDATKIYPGNHMPDMTVVEFITEIGKYFNLQFDINVGAKTVNIKMLKDIASFPEILDITYMCKKEYKIVHNDDSKHGNGYKLIYEVDESNKEKVDETVMSLHYVGEVDLPINLPSPLTSQNGDTAYVRGTNSFYRFDGGEWLPFVDNFLPWSSNSLSNDLVELKLQCGPVRMKYINGPFGTGDPGSAFGTYIAPPAFTGFLVPCSSVGMAGDAVLCQIVENAYSYYQIFESQNAGPNKLKPRFANWLGKQKSITSDAQVRPFGTCANMNAITNVYTDYRTFIHGPNVARGIAEAFWKPFTDLLLGGITVEQDVLLDLVTYIKTNWGSTKMKKDAQIFILNFGEFGLPFPDFTKMTLTRI